jgi:hypothetical protein
MTKDMQQINELNRHSHARTETQGGQAGATRSAVVRCPVFYSVVRPGKGRLLGTSSADDMQSRMLLRRELKKKRKEGERESVSKNCKAIALIK